MLKFAPLHALPGPAMAAVRRGLTESHLNGGAALAADRPVSSISRHCLAFGRQQGLAQIMLFIQQPRRKEACHD
jgi:hypothetical protein